MTVSTLDIVGTRSYAAYRLRRTLLGLPGITVAIAALLLGIGASLQTSTFTPALLMIGVVVFVRHVAHLYLREQLENETLEISSVGNPADLLSYEIVRALKGKRVISAGDLLMAAMTTKRGKFILEETGITSTEMMSTCGKYIDEHTDIGPSLQFAGQQLKELEETRIDANVILYLFFLHVESCKKLLQQADLSEDDLRGLLHWERFHHRFRTHENTWEPDAIRRNASMGRSWMMGYTNALDSLTSEVNTVAHATGEKSIAIHREVIDNVMRVFARSKQRNVLLLGKVGVGKRTLVENIAITLRSLERAQHKTFTRVLVLQTEKLLAGVANPDAFLFDALNRAQKSGDFILVIRDKAFLLQSANGNLRAVLMKFLESKNINVIGIADLQDYHSLIKAEPLLDSLFEKIPVEDATDEETLTVLMAHYFTLERKNVRITYKALHSIIDLSKRYLGSLGGFPGKAIDVMDDAILRATEGGHAFVHEEHVRDVISLKSKVNVKRVTQDEKERLLNLEEKMKARVIGQEVAIKSVSSALRRARMDLSDRKRPVGTFLFLGPTGVGKTQTAKVLAEEYFGSADAMIRLDMNEYSHADSVFNITGSAGKEGFLAQRVQDKPFSLILLDEIEKAHPSVLNVFLQILDEGFLNDGRGLRTDFRNTIIIATSNAGALFIRDFFRTHPSPEKQNFKSELLETILKEKLFSPEFLNRFDEIVLYYPLSQDGAARVAVLMLDDIVTDIRKRRGISIEIEEDVVGGLVERGYSVEFGAREMRRTVTDMIEDYLAEYMLKNDVKRGDVIVIRKGDVKW